MLAPRLADMSAAVALRKESVDRNQSFCIFLSLRLPSLSARRAWIEIQAIRVNVVLLPGRSPQGERG